MQINREPINFKTDDENYEALKSWQDKYIKGNNTHKGSISFHVGSTVAMQGEDGGSWMHGMVVEGTSIDQNRQSYIVRVTKMGRLITLYARHI